MAGGLSPCASPLPCKSSGSVQLLAGQEHQALPISLAGWEGWDARLWLGCTGCVGEELHWLRGEGDSDSPQKVSGPRLLPPAFLCERPSVWGYWLLLTPMLTPMPPSPPTDQGRE